MLRQWRDKTEEFEAEAGSEDFKRTVQFAEDDFNRVVMMEDLVVWVVEDSKYTLFINKLDPQNLPNSQNWAYL